jgi:hypothetical protein
VQSRSGQLIVSRVDPCFNRGQASWKPRYQLQLTFLDAASPESPHMMNSPEALAGQRMSPSARSGQEARMRESNIRRFALAVALAGPVSACETQGQRIPLITAEAASQLPASELPRVFKDPNPLVPYPYNIHETDGLSRNPDDCVRWGCIDQGNR